MGFIKGNTNSFEVFLTDYGLQTFYRDGLMDESIFFSVSDDDANYRIFSSQRYDPVNIFDNPGNIISAIGVESDKFINGQHNVYTQTNKRGRMNNGILRYEILKTNDDTFKNYVAYEGDLTTTEDYSLLSYRNINDTKQFNVKGVNGLYLSYPYDSLSDENKIYDIDSYPQSDKDPEFTYVNSKFELIDDVKSFSGSNDVKKLNQTVNYSNILRSGYLIQNEKYNIDFELKFSFFNVDVISQAINLKIFVILGKNKIPVEIYTPGDTAIPAVNQHAVDDSNVEINTSFVEIDRAADDVLNIKQVMTLTGTTALVGNVNCRVIDGICKKSKDFTIQIEYDKKGTSDAPILDFTINNLSVNYIGVSVSDPKLVPIKHTSSLDTVHILNKNTKSVLFDDVVFKDAILRNRNLTALVKNLVLLNTVTLIENDLVNISYTFGYDGQTKGIGVLTISYPYSYYTKENKLILPFQSFPIAASYNVLDPGGYSVNHYYGQSLLEPNKRTGIIDMNFSFNCFNGAGKQITEEVTISVNLINGGFVRPDDEPVIVPPVPTGKNIFVRNLVNESVIDGVFLESEILFITPLGGDSFPLAFNQTLEGHYDTFNERIMVRLSGDGFGQINIYRHGTLLETIFTIEAGDYLTENAYLFNNKFSISEEFGDQLLIEFINT